MIYSAYTTGSARVKFNKVFTIGILLVAALWMAVPVKADLIELTNGDHYRGLVVSMTATNVEFISEVQGKVHLPRNMIAQITLHDVVAKSVTVTNAAAATTVAPLILSGPSSPSVVSGAPAPAAAPTGSQSDAVVQQMRQQGVDPKLIDQVQEQIFGKSSPEAAQKFNEMIGSLTTGSMSMRDLRNQAQASIDQIKSAKKEFGGDAGEMLDGYLVILQKFVADADSGSAPPAAVSTTK